MMLPNSLKNLLSNPREATSELLSEINDAVKPNDFPTQDQMAKNLAENNVTTKPSESEMLETGKMQFIDLDITGTGDNEVKLRDQTKIEDDVDYVVIRVKAFVSQLRDKAGVKFKLWFPK